MSDPFHRLAWLTRTNHGTFRGLVRSGLAQARWLAGGLEGGLNPDLASVERLVFVCLGNINRSCFAEMAAKALGVDAVSVGLSTTTGAPPTSLAVRTAQRFQLDLAGHRATNLTDHAPRPGDLLLAMEFRHVRRLQASGLGSCPVALLGQWSSPRRLHIHDPHTLSEAYFDTCFTLIHSATRNLVHAWCSARQGGG